MKVRITAPARKQASGMDRWWRENRPAAPGLLAQELADARRLLAATPELGSPYFERSDVVVRRLLLRKTQNHVYYEIDRVAGIVMIIAVWGASKGEGPTL